MDAPPPAFAHVLHTYRRAAGLTQDALAQRAGLSAHTISDLERGVKQAPHLSTVRRLATALDLAPPDRARLEAAAHRLDGRSAAHVAARPALPRPLLPLIGRTKELATLQALLRSDAIRLLTLTGPGGVGKTRLALEAAAALQPHVAHGVVFVALAPLRDPALVPGALARALGVQERGGQEPVATLGAALRWRHLLLLLDSFEHLRPAAPLLPDLLAACPRLTVLVTSRARLHVSGERVRPLAPLAVPDPAHLPPPERLAAYGAIALFVERARAVRPSFALSAENASAVAALCHRLDGLPLAIELAAARVPLLPPPALLARLERPLPLLTGGAHDAPAHQQTLRDTIAWSHDLLGAPEQALFRRLAVFTGGWALEAAEAICTRVGDAAVDVDVDVDVDMDVDVDVLAGLDALADHSLIQPEERAGAGPRCGLLATIRAYAQERLETGGEAAAARRQHAAYYLALGATARPDLEGPRQAAAAARLAAEHDNLRAALQWCLDGGDVARGLEVSGALWRFWLQQGDLREGRRWLEAFLAARRALGDVPGIASTLGNLAMLHRRRHDYVGAAALGAESLALWRRVGDVRGIGLALGNLGEISALHGDHPRAAALLAESLACARQAGDASVVANVLHSRGQAAWAQGQYQQAEAAYHQALHVLRDAADTMTMADCLEGLAAVAAEQHHPAQAAWCHGAVSALHETSGAPVVDPTAFDHVAAAARLELGEKGFEAKQAEGRALALEDALAALLE